MKLPRRQFLHLAAGAAALPAVSRVARAQAYPSRPVRIVVGFPAGGSFDVVARLFGQWLSERLGQPFIVENRSGAGGNIGTEVVVNAQPDGYTLLLVNDTHAVNATLYEKLNFNFIRDIAPIASIASVPNVMQVNPAVPAQSVSEFIAYAKANPGMASGGNGTPAHVSGELFKIMTGVNMLHVPYRGGPPAIADLIGGQVQVMFPNIPQTIEILKSGKLRPLGVTTATRLDVLPEVPTVGETVPGYETIGWIGLGAPRRTSAELIGRLNSEIQRALDDPKIKARLSDLGVTRVSGSPADFGKLIADETEKWGKVIRTANIKPD
jgi:tripartite-type tricarboxylate transporter receptor subunit TctC